MQQKLLYSWHRDEQGSDTVFSRFATPKGFKRQIVDDKSFGKWLRHLPLKKKNAMVKSFDGAVLMAPAAAVVDLDVGTKDLQQCADSILRLRAEFLKAERRESEIAFHFTSGDLSSWTKWKRGYHPLVAGSKVTFVKRAKADDSPAVFQSYLENLFLYAGTASLAAYSKKRVYKALEPGDFFVLGGFPGHAVLVLDVARDQKGETLFLLGQGYMPAQSFHVVKNKKGEVWLGLDEKGELRIPTWPKPFLKSSLHRF
ncbi:MAG: DUF4846 domain-containing protein [Deltaproteobacteria bacterium]|nr:DUF4846 domain-containing protein [Deltaproteobacteria bacterium]